MERDEFIILLFSILGYFYPLPLPLAEQPPPPQKKENEKNAGRYHHVMCTKNYDQIMYDS